MHAFAKMPHNMLKFGSANNFSGNIEHKGTGIEGNCERSCRKKTKAVRFIYDLDVVIIGQCHRNIDSNGSNHQYYNIKSYKKALSTYGCTRPPGQPQGDRQG